MEKYSPAIHLTDQELKDLDPHETRNYLRAYKNRDREKLEHRVADRGNYIEELEFHLKKLKGQQKWDLNEIHFIDTGKYNHDKFGVEAGSPWKNTK